MCEVRATHAPLPHRHVQVVTSGRQALGIEDLELQVALLGHLPRPLREALGVDDVGRLVDDVARDADGFGDRLAELELAVLRGRGLRGRQDVDALEGALRLAITREVFGKAVGAEHRALGDGSEIGDALGQRHADARRMSGEAAAHGAGDGGREPGSLSVAALSVAALPSAADQDLRGGHAPEARQLDELPGLAGELHGLQVAQQSSFEGSVQGLQPWMLLELVLETDDAQGVDAASGGVAGGNLELERHVNSSSTVPGRCDCNKPLRAISLERRALPGSPRAARFMKRRSTPASAHDVG